MGWTPARDGTTVPPGETGARFMKKATMFRRLIDAGETLVPRQPVEEGRVIERPDLAASFAELNDLMDLGTIRELERKFPVRSRLQSEYGNRPGAER
jgi:hypothetical protein